MRFTTIKAAALTMCGAMLFTSCIKDEFADQGAAGKNIIKINEATENKIFSEPFTNVRDFSLFSLRKDANSNASLNTATQVRIKQNNTLVSDYNTANGENFELLPDSLYTRDASITLSGDTYTMNIASGDFAKEFMIKLNGAKWNLAKKYALGFSIATVDGTDNQISADRKDVLVLIAIKNKWDGVYSITGTFSDVTNAAFVGAYPLEWQLRTTSATQCVVVDDVYLGIPGFVFNTGAGLSYYGSFGLIVNFDPATDRIASVVNFYGQPSGNTRSAELDPTGLNRYDNATKTIDIKYFMRQTNAVPAAPNIRCRFNEQWKFKRSR